MTRLSSEHLREIFIPEKFCGLIFKTLGASLFDLVSRAWDLRPDELSSSLSGKKLAAISITNGEGRIEGFSETVAATAGLLGLEARVMRNPDAEGFREAGEWGADILIYSDDFDFVSEEVKSGNTIHNNPATSRVFAAALEFLAGGFLENRKVHILGLGPVGIFAALRFKELGARTLLYDINFEGMAPLIDDLSLGEVILGEEALLESLQKSKNPLIFEAVPRKHLFSARLQEKILNEDVCPLVSAPGVPLSWPFSWLGGSAKGKLFHEPLMAGTASMLAGLAVKNYLPEYGFSFPANFADRKMAVLL